MSIFFRVKQLWFLIWLDFYLLNILITFLDVGKKYKTHLYFCIFLKKSIIHLIFWTFCAILRPFICVMGYTPF
jgi:hypothetical protein